MKANNIRWLAVIIVIIIAAIIPQFKAQAGEDLVPSQEGPWEFVFELARKLALKATDSWQYTDKNGNIDCYTIYRGERYTELLKFIDALHNAGIRAFFIGDSLDINVNIKGPCPPMPPLYPEVRIRAEDNKSPSAKFALSPVLIPAIAAVIVLIVAAVAGAVLAGGRGAVAGGAFALLVIGLVFLL